MPIRISALPWHLQADVINKLNGGDFVSFAKSSKYAKESLRCRGAAVLAPRNLGDRVNFKFINGSIEVSFYKLDCGKYSGIQTTKTLQLSQLDGFRLDSSIMSIKSELNDDFCRGLISFFQQSGSNTHSFRLEEEGVSCGPEIFTELLKVSSAKGLEAERRFLSCEYIENIPQNLELISLMSSVGDEEFLNMKVLNAELHATLITSAGINQFLKEVCDGKRIFESIFIHTERRLVTDEVLRGMDYYTRDNERFEIRIGEARLKFTLYSTHFIASWIHED